MNSGIYDIPAEEYHRDCCPEPSLSASIIHTMLSCSPAHARHEHPKLNPDYRPEESERFDRGTAAHAYLLQGETAFEIIDAPDFRTKAAREARDAARAAGKTPLLAKHWQDVLDMVEAANRQLDDFRDPPRPFSAGKPERTVVWMESVGSKVVWMRARLDWLHDDRRWIDDLKTSGGSVHPEVWGRKLWADGYDCQAAFYIRGVKAISGVEPTFRFVACENTAPYCLSVLSPSPQMLELARRKVEQAIATWADCLTSGYWPAYPQRTCYVDTPPFEEARQMERELRDVE